MVSPDDSVYAPSELVESVLSKLEDSGVPERVCDEICKLIEAWEDSEERKARGVVDVADAKDSEDGPCVIFFTCGVCGHAEAEVTGWESGAPIEATCLGCGSELCITDERGTPQ